MSNRDYYPPGSGAKGKPVGSFQRLDFIPARMRPKPKSETTPEESSPIETGGKLYPSTFVIQETSKMSLKEAGEFLLELGYKASEIKEQFKTKTVRLQQVAIEKARSQNMWQEEKPENWVGDPPVGE